MASTGTGIHRDVKRDEAMDIRGQGSLREESDSQSPLPDSTTAQSSATAMSPSKKRRKVNHGELFIPRSKYMGTSQRTRV